MFFYYMNTQRVKCDDISVWQCSVQRQNVGNTFFKVVQSELKKMKFGQGVKLKKREHPNIFGVSLKIFELWWKEID